MTATTRALRIIATVASTITLLGTGYLYGITVGPALTTDERAANTMITGGIIIVFGLMTILAAILRSGARYRDQGIRRSAPGPGQSLELISLHEPTE
jgi:cytochrome c biogenesis protein CcdA